MAFTAVPVSTGDAAVEAEPVLSAFDAFAVLPPLLPPLPMAGTAAPKPAPKPNALGALDAIGG
jgi:hypothetical protein